MEEKPAIRREGSPDPRTWLGRNLFAQATRFTQLCAAAAFFIAVSAVAGWLFDARFLAGQWRQYVPMAPSSALAFLLLSSGVFSHARGPGRPLVRSFELAAAGLPALLGLLVLAQSFAGFDSGVERLLSRTNEQLGQVRLGRMSPLTAVTFLLEGAALMLLLRATRWRFAAAAAALFASTGAAINLVVSLGYSYGVPLLYGGATIPVALPTALAFVLLGAGELKLALPGVPLLRAWSGDSVRGGLLRAFLPGVLVLIFFEGWLDAVMVTPEALNPALWQSLKGLVACILIVCLTAWTARRTGDAMER
ncbi:MAG: hypothetical protein HZB13_00065, partial [Acidobacteria bacterium]|nr:hypothetical protein [Acidobacteriota bacterium]